MKEKIQVTRQPGNLHFLMLAPPDKHRDFVAKVNSWSYPVEGKYFKGKQAPYVLEFRAYEIRCPTKEMEEQFCQDFGVSDMLEDGIGGVTRNWKYVMFNFILKTLRKFTPYQPVIRAKGNQKNTMSGWHYAVGAGTIPRKPVKTEVDSERVVL